MPTCSYHPDVETNLRCSRCERYICPKELVQTPVGARCPDCAQVKRIPTYDIRAQHYGRAIGAAAVVGVGVGIAWGFFMPLIRGIPFVPWLVGVGAAYLIGEAVSLAVNRKRGPSLAAIAAIGVLTSFLVAAMMWGVLQGWGPMTGFRLHLYNPWGLILLVVSIVVAVGRVGR